jgi:O-antigen ligase
MRPHPEIANDTSMPGADAAALAGCCAYLFLFALPLGWDAPLVVLSLAALIPGAAIERGLRGPGKHIAAGVLLLVAATLVSVAASPDLRQSALGSTPMLPATLLFWILCYRLPVSHARALLLSLMGLAALVAAWTILAWRVDDSHSPHVWIRGVARIVSVPNDTLILAVLSPVSLAIVCSERSASWRAAGVATLLLGVVAIVLARSRLGIATMVVAFLATLLALGRFRLRWLLALAATAFAADAMSGFALLHKFVDTRSAPRIALWWAAGSMFLDAPLSGQGPNTFGALRPEFVASFPGTAWLGVEQGYVPWPHELYLELLAERGVFALAGFCIALLAALKGARAMCRDASVDVRMAAQCSFGALVSIAFAGLAELSMLHLWVPVITFTFLGLVAMLANSRRSLP